MAFPTEDLSEPSALDVEDASGGDQVPDSLDTRPAVAEGDTAAVLPAVAEGDTAAVLPAVTGGDSTAAIPGVAESDSIASPPAAGGDEILDAAQAFEAFLRRDDYGFLAAWADWASDTTTVRPLRFAPREHPVVDPLLERLRRRFHSRYYLRQEMNFFPELFDNSDSIIVAVEARADSLVDEEAIARGVLFASRETGGVRYIAPTIPPLGKQKSTWGKLTEQHSVDLDRAIMTREFLHQGTPVYRRAGEPYAQYLLHMMRRQSREIWKREIASSMKDATLEGGRAGLVRLTMPFEMPKSVQSILGKGKPNLQVSGSENITFGGKSQWFPHRPNYEFQKKQSKFPQLQMEQQLTIRLKGSIGDKLDIDIDQSSQAQTSLANRMKIHYKGYEDEIIRRVDLGNTSLRLPGTEYVSYGGRHTGLFGISTEAQLGSVTLNMIVSKQEGEAATKSSSMRGEKKSKTIKDSEYIRNRFFFLDDPTRDGHPAQNRWVADIDASTVELWLDDGDGKLSETFATRYGKAVLDLDSPTPTAEDTVQTDILSFELLEPGKDYYLYVDERFEEGDSEAHPYIVLNRYLEPNHTLGVTYQDLGRDTMVGGPGAEGDTLYYVKALRCKNDLLEEDVTSGNWAATDRLMLKNVYYIAPGSSEDFWTSTGLPEDVIKEEGFQLSIHYDGTVESAEDPDELESVKLIRYLGLDYFQETDQGLVVGEDGDVDVRPWVNLSQGLLYFPDLRPFAPDPAAGYGLRGRPISAAPWDTLPEMVGDQITRNPEIYTSKSCVRSTGGEGTHWQSRFYIQVEYETPVTELRIDAWDVIEGSEVVTVGSRRLTKDRDYRINYQTGVIQILDRSTVGEDQQIDVTYKRAGGFGTASKTLLGMAAFYQPTDSKFDFSTSWLYERKGSPDRRPRLGSEPTQMAVGEIASRYSFESMLLTRALDKLPFLETRQPSRISLDGGLGVSFPNPNTRGNLYIDDFEGVAEDIAVRRNRLAWKPSSIPLTAPGYTEADRAARRGEVWWYTPYHAVHQGDLNPTLDTQEANDYMQVLELQYYPYPSPDDYMEDYWTAEESWGGIVQGLSQYNLDLSQVRFLDIWVNDFATWEEFQQDPDSRSGTMYIDIGQVSEVSLWQRRPVECDANPPIIHGDPIAPPENTGSPVTEDKSNDGELDLTGDPENDEDTGLDGELDETGDASFDDYNYDADAYSEEILDGTEACEAYAKINGTEGNGRLDTEDLDGDNTQSAINSYFQFRVDLDDTTWVETDVRRDYSGSPDIRWPLDEVPYDNGWRRIRIPLSDAFVDSFVNNPSWTKVKHLRIWFTGMDARQHRIQIGSIELRGNRWIVEAVQDSSGDIDPVDLAAREEDFYPGFVNNKENADIYEPPIEEFRERKNDNIREQEQSLTLEMRNFQPGHDGRIYMPFRVDQDYMSYEYLEFWLSSTVPEDRDAEFYMRFCKNENDDTNHYYEYRVKLQSDQKLQGARRSGLWKRVKIRLTDLSDIKETVEADTLTGIRLSPIFADSSQYVIKGQPYLTKIRRITMGVRVPEDAPPIEEAAIWIDELRLTHVHKESDYAYRVQLRSELSDFAKFDLSYKRVGADFVSISGGGFRTQKQVETALSATTSMPLDRLMPRKAGVRLPFSFAYTKNKRIPKYRTNDDILVGDAPTDRDITESVSRQTSLSISRDATTNPWLKYTINALRLSGSYKENYTNNPNQRDSTRTASFSASYNVPFGSWGDVRFYKNWKLRLLPNNFSVAMSRGQTERKTYRRENADISQPFALDDSRTTRSGGLSLSTGLRPLQAVSYNFKQNRDLMLRQEEKLLGGLNIGSETSRNEDLNASYTLRLKKDWLEPRLSWKGSFNGKFNQQERVGDGDLVRTATITNNRSATASGDLPIREFFSMLGRMANPPPGAGEEVEEEPEEEPPPEEEAIEGEEDPRGIRRPERPGRRSGGRRRSQGSGTSEGGGFSSVANYIDLTRSSGTFTAGEQSTFSRADGEPSLAYQLGFSMDPGVQQLSSGRESRSKSQIYSMNADMKLLRKVTVNTKFSHNRSNAINQGTRTGSRTTDWPEMDIRWGDVSKLLRVRRFVKSMKVTTRFSRKASSTLREGETTKRTVDSQWSPLADVSASLKNGVSVAMRVDKTGNHSEDLSSGWGRETDRNTARFSFSARKSFNIVREVVLPLTDRKERITTRLDLGLTIKLDKTKNTSYETGRKPLVTSDTRRFDIALNGSYQFSKAVTGKMLINVGENADNKNKTKTSRYVQVQFTAGFSF